MSPFYFCFVLMTYLHVAEIVQAKNYEAEGYFVVDKEVVQAYIKSIPDNVAEDVKRAQAMSELQKDIYFIISEVNNIFKSLEKNDLYLQVKLRKVEILMSSIVLETSILPGTTNGVAAKDALAKFESWLRSENSYANLKFDFAFLWTGFNLHSDDSANTGYAHVGTACDSKLATGVGEFDRTYHTALTTAHEIGHLLGSGHGCQATGHIMSPTLNIADTMKWFFSSCSMSDIKNYINILPKNCLLTSDPSSTKPSVDYKAYTGQMLNPDVTCQRAENSLDSYMCKSWSLYNTTAPRGDKVCTYILCAKPGTESCISIVTPEGMICDSGKRCKTGRCIPDSTVPIVSDSQCVLGDQGQVRFRNLPFNGSCQQFLEKHGGMQCYNDVVKQLCCEACKAYNTGVPGCEFGDKSADCVRYEKSVVCRSNGPVCCQYCGSYPTKRSVGARRRRQENYPEIVISPDVTLPVTYVSLSETEAEHGCQS